MIEPLAQHQSGDQYIINTHPLTTGIYFIQIKTQSAFLSKRFVKY
jgi:hypothetical protein